MKWVEIGKRFLLAAIIAPACLLAFVVIHEMGHTLLARWLGDPASTFYLARMDPDGVGMCLGCNITDHTRLTPVENLVVSLGGLMFTQATALGCLLLASRLGGQLSWRRRLLWIGTGFAFLDVVVQVGQGLLYDWEAHEWPTNVDLMDAMQLVIRFTRWEQAFLKFFLLGAGLAYLVFILALRQRVGASTDAVGHSMEM